MDFQTEKLLKECNASSEVIKKFKENEIGLKALPYLREKQLKYLFGGKIGKIAEFCGEVSRLNNSDGYSKYITKQNKYSYFKNPRNHLLKQNSTAFSSSQIQGVSSTNGIKLGISNELCRKRAQHRLPLEHTTPKIIAVKSLQDLTEASVLHEEMPPTSVLECISILDVGESPLSIGSGQGDILFPSVSKDGVINATDISSNNSVAMYLKSSVAGRVLLNLVPSQLCDDSVRNDLADFIVKSEFGENENKVISPGRLQKLAEEIAVVFPSEEEESYYIPRQKKSYVRDAMNPRGKLYHKYVKFVSLLKKAQLRT